MREHSANRPQARSRGALFALLAFLAIAFAGFLALGVWQVQRLSWKLDLIERVEARVHAPPAPAPGPLDWTRVSAARDEYKHVRLAGRFLSDRDTRVQAVTDLGAGFWLLSPFELKDGTVVLVNRGFVPQDWRGESLSSATAVTGLLRLSEPSGAFLRRNVPAQDRWYSRDVSAIAKARGLGQVAPYFVDADRDAATAATDWPRGGLTVTRFRNNHLVYALTWFALALMTAFAAAYVTREERRRRAAH